MKTLFLHIGLHKTGSTTLQAFLKKNRDLLSDNGYFYPTIGIPEQHDGQHNLAWLLKGDRRANSALGTLPELHKKIQAEKSEKIIISSEDFETENKQLIERFYSEFKTYNVKIIIYLRRQDKRLESTYAQLIKMGACSDDIISFCEKQKKNHDYYKFLQPWQEIFKKENLIIRPLEKCQIPNICFDFIKILGITNLNQFVEVKNQNLKLGLKTLEVLRVLNEIFSSEIMQKPDSRQEIVTKYHKKIIQFAERSWTQSKNYSLLSYPQAVQLMEEFEESNLKVAQEYLDRQDQTLFYEKIEYYDNENLDIEKLTNKEILSLLFTLLK